MLDVMDSVLSALVWLFKSILSGIAWVLSQVWELIEFLLGILESLIKCCPGPTILILLAFIAIYFIWKRVNKARGIIPDRWWKKPGLVVIILWLIVSATVCTIFRFLPKRTKVDVEISVKERQAGQDNSPN